MYQSVTFTAAEAKEFIELGDFFRLFEANNDLTINFYQAGREVANVTASEGYSERFSEGFDRVRITSATAQDVTFVIRFGNTVSYDRPPTGAALQGAFTNTQKTVTNASAQMLAANANRRYLLIQNNDTTGAIYVRLDGGTATTATGVKIDAGGSLEMAVYVPSGAITAIGSIASNANIVTVEG